MPQYRGVIRRVGAKEGDMIVNSAGAGAVGNVRVSGKVSVIEIGDTMLRDVGCTRDIYDLIDPGREAILYVHNHFFNKPVVIGIKYLDDGKTHMIRFGTLIASALGYLLLYPLLVLVGGFMLGMLGGKDGGVMSTLAVLFIIAGLGFCAWTAGMLVKNWFAWKGA